MSSSSPSLSSTDSLTSSLPVVINTRPVERAAPLTHHLQTLGFTVVDMPMLALQSRAVADADRAIMRQWLAGEYQALVIVSPTAAASGLAVWQALTQANDCQNNNGQSALNLANPPSHLIAVGEATAAVLDEALLNQETFNDNERAPASYQVLQPKIANNEGMLAMPEIECLQAGDKLLVWRGLGGRRLLVDTLKARGVHIDSIAWYERTMPEAAVAQYQLWQQQFCMMQHSMPPQTPKPVVIISSGTAFEHWVSVINESLPVDSDLSLKNNVPLQLTDFSYVVLGVRLANMVADRGLSYWRVEDLAPATIASAITY